MLCKRASICKTCEVCEPSTSRIRAKYIILPISSIQGKICCNGERCCTQSSYLGQQMISWFLISLRNRLVFMLTSANESFKYFSPRSGKWTVLIPPLTLPFLERSHERERARSKNTSRSRSAYWLTSCVYFPAQYSQQTPRYFLHVLQHFWSYIVRIVSCFNANPAVFFLSSNIGISP